MKTRICLLAIFCMAVTQLCAQVTGVVSNQKGEAVAFVNVINKNNQRGTYTNNSGDFSLNAAVGDTLVFSAIGYADVSILASNNMQVSIKQSLTNLDEVLVTASRAGNSRAKTPAAIASIDEKQLKQVHATTIDQVLNQATGVHMVDLGNEQHAMSIRQPLGYGSTYLYLEDGVPIRSSGIFNHNALLEMNMAAVERIEIVRGPASSTYGAEAIGGAVNFITKKPSAVPTAGLQLQGNNIGYKRADFYAANTFNNKFGVRVAGYHANQQDGTIEHSDFTKTAVSVNANYAINNKASLEFSTAYVDYMSDMSGSLNATRFYEKDYASNQTFTNREVDALRNKLALHYQWNSTAQSNVTLYHRSNSIKQNPSYRVSDDFKPWLGSGDPTKAHGEINDNSFNSYGVLAYHSQYLSKINTKVTGGINIENSPNTYDANYITINKQGDVYADFTKTDSLLASYKVDIVTSSAFAQFNIDLSDKLQIVLAGRYDVFDYDFTNNLDSNAFSGVANGKSTFGQFTPKLGATYRASDKFNLYANYGQGFVAPQITQLYRGTKVPNLKPAYYENYEIGFQTALENNTVLLDVAFYQLLGQDEIISVRNNDGTFQNANAGKTKHEGIEVGLVILPVKDLKIRLNGTWASHTFEEYVERGNDFNGKKMAMAPELLGSIIATYTPSIFAKGAFISAEAQTVPPYFMDAANTKRYGGYSIFNIRLGYSKKAWDFWVNAINVGDRLYANTASSSTWGESYNLGTPRAFTLGLGYNFTAKK